MSELGYRPCVGVMMVNAQGKAFVGKRIDNKEGDWWQMPQGGVDEGEDPDTAMIRELGEETGVRVEHIAVLKRMEETVRYDLPEELIGKLWDGRYRGQEQVWYLVRFLGEDYDIDLEAHSPPEFCEFQWIDPEQLPDMIVPFKKRIYRQVVEAFRALV